MQEEVLATPESDEAQRIIDALFSHLHQINQYPNSIIGALSIAYSVFAELEVGSPVDEEDFDLSCKMLLKYASVLSRDERGDAWEQIVQKCADLAEAIFGDERMTAMAQELRDEVAEQDEYFQKELDRPPSGELN